MQPKTHTLTLCEWNHIVRAVRLLREVIEGYPEVVTQTQENILLTAEEIIGEDTDCGY